MPPRKLAWWAALFVCVLGGFVLRVWNLDFDQRQHLHPDERHWSLTAAALAAEPAPVRHGTLAGPVLDWLDGQRSPTNPYRGTDSFVYGPITLTATRAVAGWLHDGAVGGDEPASLIVRTIDHLGIPLLGADGSPRFDDGYQIDLIGRLLGALADTATILVVAGIGHRIAGRRVALAAAMFQAGSVLAIQHAHYFGSEPWLGLAAASTVLATLRIDRSGRTRPAVASGLVAGMAIGGLLAVKLTGAGLALVPFALCAWLSVFRHRRADLARLGALVAGAIVTFRVLCPPAFDGLGVGLSSQFWDDVRRSQQLAGADFPPAIQWAKRVPVLEALRWLAVFTVGPGAFVSSGVGAVALIRRRGRIGRWMPAVLVGSMVLPALFVVRGRVTTGRYFVPMLPALHVCAGVGLVALVVRGAGLWHTMTMRSRQRQRSLRCLAGVLVAAAVLWPVAFVAGVYGHDNTRVEASQWIASNVAAGSVLSLEGWDDALPLAIGGVDTTAYRHEQFDLFGVDSVDKIERLARQLSAVDFVVESSPRVWATVTRIPARFPSTITLFEMLDTGALGFERVATFSNPPQLGPFRLDDRDAEEAFSVYDHPEVRIWQRTRDLPLDRILAALNPVAAATALPVTAVDAASNGAMLYPGEVAANERVGTFADAFATGANPWLQAVGWFLLLELLGAATFALFLPALRRLPDGGAGVAMTLGVGSVASVVFLAVTWGGQPLTRGLVVGVTAAWVAVGAGAGWRRRRLLRDVCSTRRAALVQVQVVVALAFFLVLLIRAADPDLWHPSRGGEKQFELAMLTSMLRTRTLPQPDLWFSGGALNYYYGGYLLVSVPARILRTAPALAMNLGVAMVAAVASGAAYSSGSAIAAIGGDERRPLRATAASTAASTARSRRARRAALLAVAFVLVVPNMAIVPAIARRLAGRENGPIDWWGLSRVVPNSPVVTEFPSWSLMFGDLHPHLLDLALVMTLIAVGAAWFSSLREARSGLQGILLAATVGGLVGLVRAVNTWDYPLAIVLGAAPVIAAFALHALGARRCRAPDGDGRLGWEWPRFLGPSLVAVAVAGGAWAPYAWRSQVTDSGLMRAEGATPLASWLEQFGLFAGITVLALALVAIETVPRWLELIRTVTARRRATVIVLAGAVAVAVLGVASHGHRVLLASSLLSMGSLGAAVATGWGRQAGPNPAALLTLGLGWAMIAGIEAVSVVNDFGRMNTVFKGWFQAWVLLGIGSAVVVAGEMRRRAGGLRRAPPRVRVAVAGAAAALLVAALTTTAFVQLALPARVDDRVSRGGLSLDGSAFLDAGLDVVDDPARERGDLDATFDPGEDRPLIEWLQANVRGLVTVAEAPGRDYAWTSRIAANAGLPTVIGWPYHESQQRRTYASVVDGRVADMTDLYTSDDDAVVTSVLQRYDIRYVVFGTAERSLGGEAGRRMLRSVSCLDIEFERHELFVAAVDQSCLAEQPGALPR